MNDISAHHTMHLVDDRVLQFTGWTFG